MTNPAAIDLRALGEPCIGNERKLTAAVKALREQVAGLLDETDRAHAETSRANTRVAYYEGVLCLPDKQGLWAVSSDDAVSAVNHERVVDVLARAETAEARVAELNHWRDRAVEHADHALATEICVAELAGALELEKALIGTAQNILCMYLEPGEQRIQAEKDAIDALLHLFDGTAQRVAKAQTDTALAATPATVLERASAKDEAVRALRIVRPMLGAPHDHTIADVWKAQRQADEALAKLDALDQEDST